MDIIQSIKTAFSRTTAAAPQVNPLAISSDLLAMHGSITASATTATWDGAKFPGGYGATQLFGVDYWTLRARSSELFTSNLYARGLIRRLITNEINTGLWPEAMPDPGIVGVDIDALDTWSEDMETRFGLWGKSPEVCDFKKTSPLNKIQAMARQEALVGGDCLVVLQVDVRTKRPSVRLIKGANVKTPFDKDTGDRTVKYGVHLDPQGRHLGFYVDQPNGPSKYVPAFGSRSGRRVAWLVYGTDHRLDTVRGVPLLGLILQSIKELDRYRDNAQRAAVVNSMLAMFIKKTEDKPGTMPMTGAAVRKGTAPVSDSTADGGSRDLSFSKHMPGVVFEELQTGEEPVAFRSNVDVDLGKFEEIIVQALAWANEIPPEILRLAFSNNYSASQAAINEFKMYLNKVRTEFGEGFNGPIYQEFLISEALLDKVSESQAILDAAADKANFERFASWAFAEWSGAIKPSTDMLKQARGYRELLKEGWITNARATRETTGQKFSRNIRQLKRENEQKIEAARPVAEFKKEFGEEIANEALGAAGQFSGNVVSLSEQIEERAE